MTEKMDPLSDRILVTGAGGYVGAKVIENLLDLQCRNIICLVRPTSRLERLNKVIKNYPDAQVEIFKGNLLSADDCSKITQDIQIVYHLAAGVDKSFPAAFLNSVVTTRNLLDAVVRGNTVKRFVNVSSFAVYSNRDKRRHSLLDETCPVHEPADLLDEAYVYGKIKQDELVMQYAEKHNLPYVTARPSVVFGPGKNFVPSRIGIDTFGFFMHIGGPIQLPLTYVDNCADAIVKLGFKEGIEGQVFNIVDDDLPSSRQYLKKYKKNVKKIRSVYFPYRLFYLFCFIWERYAVKSRGQLPNAFNRAKCATYWKGNTYSNEKLKSIGWLPRISFDQALDNFFEYQKGQAS